MIVGTLREAGPDTHVWAWAGVLNPGFWARRMTHEPAIHRADATLAAGLPYEADADLAADAIDEWMGIIEFVQRTQPHDEASELVGPGRSIHLHATDTSPGLNAERSEMGVPPPEGLGEGHRAHREGRRLAPGP
jgi:hypothetical protein